MGETGVESAGRIEQAAGTVQETAQAQALAPALVSALVSALAEGTLRIDFTPEGRVVQADRTALERFGYTEQELTGAEHRTLCAPEEADSAAVHSMWQRVRDGHRVAGVFRRRDRSGDAVWLRGHYIPVPDPDGRTGLIVLVARDIGAEIRARAALEGRADAIDRSQAVIEFDLDGTVTAANDNFLAIMDYDRDEVVGYHHRMFVDEAYARSAEYHQFWNRLRAGEFVSGEFHRQGRDGRDIWLQATYNPVLDPDGRPWKVIKYALDITAEKTRTAEFEGKVTAIDRSLAVVEFGLDGSLLSANANFLAITGYDLTEVIGRPHRIFLPVGADDQQYEEFWRRLRAGEFVSGEFRRRTREGSDIWLRATYNPVLDPDGRAWKVVKYALDVTEQKLLAADYAAKMTAIDRSQLRVEFAVDGTILTANQNMLDLLGYPAQELIGRHHRMLVRPEEANDTAYHMFWDRLARGQYESGEYRRITRDHRDVWIRATYNPVLDEDGIPCKIVKFAVDVTQDKQRSVELAGRSAAIDRAQAVAEFDLDGKLLTANENFLRIMGYPLAEVVGAPHSMFCARDHLVSDEYRDFWMRLRRGELICGRFHRIGRFGRDLWLQSSYNPVLDPDGSPVRVIEYAYDVSEFVGLQHRLQVRGRRMRDAAARLGESTGRVADRCTRADLMLAQAHAELAAGRTGVPGVLDSLGDVRRVTSHLDQAARSLTDLARHSAGTVSGLAVELGRDELDRGAVTSIVEEIRRATDRAEQSATQIAGLVEDVRLELTRGQVCTHRVDEAFARVDSVLERARQSVEATTELVRGQQALVADTGRRVDALRDAGASPADRLPGDTDHGYGGLDPQASARGTAAMSADRSPPTATDDPTG